MEKQQRVLIFLTFIFSLFAIVVTVVSLATDHWVTSNPKLVIKSNTTSSEANEVYFGLFKGYRRVNFGFAHRPANIEISCEASEGVCVVFPVSLKGSAENEYESASVYIDKIMSNRTGDEELWRLGLFNYGFWVTTIISATLSIVFGLISMGFAVFNVCGKPIETITGPMGLYLWNGIAFVFTLLELTMFLVLFLTTLKKNYLLIDNIEKFDMEEYTNLGYSFYLVPAAVALYLMNIILLVCSGYKIKCSFSSEAEKVVDNGMILY